MLGRPHGRTDTQIGRKQLMPQAHYVQGRIFAQCDMYIVHDSLHLLPFETMTLSQHINITQLYSAEYGR